MVELWIGKQLDRCPRIGSARSKSKGKKRRLRCTPALLRAVKRKNKRPCHTDDNTWQWVYRLKDRGRSGEVFYIGQTQEDQYERRCADHKRRYGFRIVCQRVMRVPNLTMALAVEQALMAVYGSGPRRSSNSALRPKRNIYLPSGFEWFKAWFSGQPGNLANGRWNVTNQTPGGVPYCVTLFAGFGALAVYPPQLFLRFPPRTRAYWPNFPGYHCFPESKTQDIFKVIEFPRRPAIDITQVV